MKISLNWLKDYVTPGVSVQSLAQKLTMAGLEVEKIETSDTDTILELEITPNRADCLNMIGIAREVGAILNKNCDFPKIAKFRFPNKRCDISIEDKKDCRCYIGTVIEDITISDTPVWIKKRIDSLNIRSINNVVDITNFCLMEFGQPLHAFDYDKLDGGKITVRRARKDETIITLDDEECTLDPSILIIADDSGPVAIAGIMGGQRTAVTSETKNILLESAHFNPILIRRASRKLGISSDSSYRFERGVDYDTVEKGAHRALTFILQYAKGTITKHLTIRLPPSNKMHQLITISVDQINNYLGSTLNASECKHILKKLEFNVSITKQTVLKIIPPTFRSDINEKVDIIEEVARIIGYDNLPLSLPQINVINIPSNEKYKHRQKIRELLSAQGLCETITYTMIGQKDLEKSKLHDCKSVSITNPLACDHQIMRPSLLPGLLSTARLNWNRGEKNIKIFELGKSYIAATEKEILGLLMTGSTNNENWHNLKKEPLNFFHIKGVLIQTFQRLGINNVRYAIKEEVFLQKGETAALHIAGKEIGILGKINTEVLENWGIKTTNVFFAQIDLERLYRKLGKLAHYQPVPEYPSIVHDISLAISKDISFQQIRDIASKVGGKVLKEIKFKEQYLGEKIPNGLRGIVFSLKYQSFEKTLTEQEVSAVHTEINQELIKTLGAIKR